ncbi:expressed unknown protein [Seminavis robusta]|uniref:Uncharacterized protein n=1 Tax=Seminavis robusta TaxID=568900 RepID=A0A9N8H612_9STRA|nr:expressed unknown protein [Seminavis robusta]|eukprot:Sro34_g022010.1 n/a (75) ;mRNA; f:85473-85780
MIKEDDVVCNTHKGPKEHRHLLESLDRQPQLTIAALPYNSPFLVLQNCFELSLFMATYKAWALGRAAPKPADGW